MTTCDQCDRNDLQQLYAELLPEAVANAMADHLVNCPACRREFEGLAGDQDWWQEASHRLSQSSAEVPGLRMKSPEANAQGIGSSRDRKLMGQQVASEDRFDDTGHYAEEDSSEEAYLCDFAVDFLEPGELKSGEAGGALGRLGDYEILEVIGRGGMGIVLKGFQKELHRYVAVKVLAPQLATSGAARRRFAREAQATAAVVNQHVMAIHSVHANAKLPYLVMPFIECESLQQRLNRTGPLDLKDVLRIGMQAASGLAAAHGQGLVHRDVKPANILLETNVDRVMLTDFGLARAVDDATLTRTGIIAGTPQYMSPEQANGDSIDHRSDLFSLGSVLYAMCTARPPFRAETTFGILRRIRETDPRPIQEINPDIPDWLERIVFRLLSKNPSARIATASDVAVLLEKCLAHVQQPTIVPLPSECLPAPVFPPGGRSRRWNSEFRHRRWLVAAALIAALTVAGMNRNAWQLTTKSSVNNQEPAKQISKSEGESNPEELPTGWDEAQHALWESEQVLIQVERSVESDLEGLDASPGGDGTRGR